MSEKKEITMSDEMHLLLETPNVEEALRQASAVWGIGAENINAEVVSEEKVFLGLFGKKLKVRLTPKKPILLLKSLDFLNDILELMDIEVAPEFTEEASMINLMGQDADILVGRYGDGLKSMEYLLNLALRNNPADEPRVRLDCNGYRARRIRSLERLAEATARRVIERGAPIRLEPMLSWERWVIHTTLKGREDVETQSVGESPERKVVVMPKISSDGMQDSQRSRAPRSKYRRRY